MNTNALTNPTVKAAVEALQSGDRKAWSALFEPGAKLYDDGAPSSRGTLSATSASLRSIVWRTTASTWSAHSIRISGAIFEPISGFSSPHPARSHAWTSGRRNRGAHHAHDHCSCDWFRLAWPVRPSRVLPWWHWRDRKGCTHLSSALARRSRHQHVYGVTRAGYSVAEEAPMFLLVFAVPAVSALIVWWMLR